MNEKESDPKALRSSGIVSPAHALLGLDENYSTIPAGTYYAVVDVEWNMITQLFPEFLTICFSVHSSQPVKIQRLSTFHGLNIFKKALFAEAQQKSVSSAQKQYFPDEMKRAFRMTELEPWGKQCPYGYIYTHNSDDRFHLKEKMEPVFTKDASLSLSQRSEPFTFISSAYDNS